VHHAIADILIVLRCPDKIHARSYRHKERPYLLAEAGQGSGEWEWKGALEPPALELPPLEASAHPALVLLPWAALAPQPLAPQSWAALAPQSLAPQSWAVLAPRSLALQAWVLQAWVRLPLADLECQHLDLHSSTVRRIRAPLSAISPCGVAAIQIPDHVHKSHTELISPIAAHMSSQEMPEYLLLAVRYVHKGVCEVDRWGLTRGGWGWQILQCLWQSFVSNLLWCVKGELWYVWQLELWTFSWLSWLRRLQTGKPEFVSAKLTEMHSGQSCQYTLVTAVAQESSNASEQYHIPLARLV